MTTFDDIFKAYEVDYDKLLEYGFKKDNHFYSLSKNIMDDKFRLDITITENKEVISKIYDIEFNDYYVAYNIATQNVEFVDSIRSQVRIILSDIKEKCFIRKYFVSEQANRIAELIIKKYGDKPIFAWDKYPSDGIFKNTNNKWYALVMNVSGNRVNRKNKNIDILNVKLDKDKIIELLERNGFCKAYHMNKKNWITIYLDNSISDEEIMNYIEESHNYTVGKEI